MSSDPLIIIPTWMRSESDLRVVQRAVVSAQVSLKNQGGDVVVIDDGSDEKWTDQLSDSCMALIHRPRHEGYTKTANLGLHMALAEDRDVVLMDSDMEFFEKGWLKKILDSPGDVVGGLLLYPNHLIQSAGVFYSILQRDFGHRFKFAPGTMAAAQERTFCPVAGSLMFIRLGTLQDVGVFDESFLLGQQDMDYCQRVAMAGGQCVYEPEVRAIHHEALFRRRTTPQMGKWEEQSWMKLREKHDGHLGLYAPNMMLDE